MSDPVYPSDKQDKFVLRLPDGMRDRIKAAADRNNRSMNAELVATLDRAYPLVNFDSIALQDLIRSFETSENQNQKIAIVNALQDFFKVSGSDIRVALDEDNEVLIYR